MKRLPALVLIALLVVLAACGGSNKVVKEKSIPDWYLSVPEDPNYLFAPATSTSRDLQVAVNKAQADGRNQIAQQLEVKYSGLTKRFQEEVGMGEEAELLDQFTQTYKAVVSQVLNGSRASQQDIVEDEGVFRAYVLMEMPIGAANQALMQKMQANQNMYTRFRATQAFDELEKEVEKYEEWKEQQGASSRASGGK